MVLRNKYNLLIELDKLEKLSINYPKELKMISLSIRNHILDCSNEESLAEFLNLINCIFENVMFILEIDDVFISFYIKMLRKYCRAYIKKENDVECHYLSLSYSSVRILSDMKNISRYMYREEKISNTFYKLEKKIINYQLHRIILNKWQNINPYLEELTTDEILNKDFIEIFDEFFELCMKNNEKLFIKNLKDMKNLNRGRRGKWISGIDLYPPSIKVAVEKNLINRFNPPGKRYIYLSTTEIDYKFKDDITFSEYICLEELRAKSGEEITLCNFKVCKRAKYDKILDLGYNDISLNDLDSILNDYIDRVVENLKSNIVKDNTYDYEKYLALELENIRSKTFEIVNEYVGKLFIKKIVDTIFIPLDDNQDSNSDVKEKCYGSFHVLANYLESKGISGMIYPSTRLMLKGDMGKNLVLFNVDTVNPIEEKIKTIIY